MLLRPNSLKKITVDGMLYKKLEDDKFLDVAGKQFIKVVNMFEFIEAEQMDSSEEEFYEDTSSDSDSSTGNSDDGDSDWVDCIDEDEQRVLFMGQLMCMGLTGHFG